MFAFALYDTEEKSLFIARDRLGIKPLYYYFHKNKFIFASEMKAILGYKEIGKNIDFATLNQYFTLRYCTGNKSIIKNIWKLLPGHYLIYKNSTLKVAKYWDVKFNPGNKTRS